MGIYAIPKGEKSLLVETKYNKKKSFQHGRIERKMTTEQKVMVIENLVLKEFKDNF